MKTQIIHLEAHDDTLSVRDKMDWAQTPRILLIWPEKGKVLRARLDLILLERYCSSHGSQLAILTADKEATYQAGEAGIPVFQNRRNAQLQPWGKSFRQFRRQQVQQFARENLPEEPFVRKESQPRKKLPLWVRIPIFTAGVFAALALAAFLLPSAEITILPEIRQQNMQIPLQAQTERSDLSLSGLIPARELIIEVDGQLSISTTGTTAIAAEYARGEVVFTNLGDVGVEIPENTILSTSGETPVLFRTLAYGQTPPEQGSEITLAVEAFLPGTTGNLPADQITKINLVAGAELIVTNPSPTSGGTDILIPAPTYVDRLKLERELTALLEDLAMDELAVRLGEDDLLLSPRFSDYEIIEEEFSPQGFDPGELLWLDRTARYQVHYLSSDDLTGLVEGLITAQYQDSPYTPDLTSIQLDTTLPPLLTANGDYSLEIEVSWTDSPVINPGEISDQIAAKSVTEAEQILNHTLDLAGNSHIILRPGWWPRIPALPFRIQIIQGGTSK